MTSNYTLKFYSHVSERGWYTGWRHKAHQFSFQHVRAASGVHEKSFVSVLEETQKHIYWKVLFCRRSSAVNQDCRSLGPWKPAHMREHYHKMLLLLHPSLHLLQETSTMEGHINLMKIWKNDQGRNSHGIGSITYNEYHHRVGSKALQVTHWWDLPQRTVEFSFPHLSPVSPTLWYLPNFSLLVGTSPWPWWAVQATVLASPSGTSPPGHI